MHLVLFCFISQDCVMFVLRINIAHLYRITSQLITLESSFQQNDISSYFKDNIDIVIVLVN